MVSTATVVAATLTTCYVAYRTINPSSEYTKERVLWLSVIKQAIMDSEGRGEVEPNLIYRASKWLRYPTRAFFTVCSLAGLSKQQALRFQEDRRDKNAKKILSR